MMINALNSGARVFMGDFEDALSPTWANVAVKASSRRPPPAHLPTDEKEYEPALDRHARHPTAWLAPRRGPHPRRCAPISASLFDFGLAFFHNAREQLDRGSGPYFYLPKLESHLEARLWNDVFTAAQNRVGIPHSSIRATVLIETILAAFEMDEILWELRDHASGLNAAAGLHLQHHQEVPIARRLHPARPRVCDLRRSPSCVPTPSCWCAPAPHRRGAHAMGGMAAFIPSRRDPEVNDRAMAAVRADKERSPPSASTAWVAHPDLVPLATEVFDAVLATRPHQKHRLRPEVAVTGPNLLDVRIPGSRVTEAGVRANVSVGLAYLASWLDGNGAAAINNLMEDAATAEISRSQLWQWRTHAPLDDGDPLTPDRYATIRDAELLATLRRPPRTRPGPMRPRCSTHLSSAISSQPS